MRSIVKLAALCAAMLAGTGSAQGPKKPRTHVKAEVGGAIRSQLPRPKSRELKARDYPKLGSITMTTTQFCGDGDVATYSQRHPNVTFVTGGQVEMLLGYWVTPAGAARPLPTVANWFPVAKASLGADGGMTDAMTSLGKAGEVRSAMSLVTQTVRGLADATGYRMPATARDASFDAHFAVMMCKPILAPSSMSGRVPTPIEVQRSFASTIPGAISTALAQKDVLDDIGSISLAVGDDHVAVKIGKNESISVRDDFFFRLALDVAAMEQPSATALDAYQTALSGLIRPALLNLYRQFTTAKACTPREVQGIASAGPYWWEPYPLQLTCGALGVGSGVPFAELVQALVAPTALPSKEDFEAARGALADVLVRAAIMQRAQEELHARYARIRPTDRCFAPGSDYIDKVMGSMMIDVGTTQQTTSVKMKHPEPNFAIGGDAPYRGGSGNAHTIFDMGGSERPLTVERGARATPPDLQTKSFMLRFNVRGIGCGTNFYCLRPDEPGPL